MINDIFLSGTCQWLLIFLVSTVVDDGMVLNSPGVSVGTVLNIHQCTPSCLWVNHFMCWIVLWKHKNIFAFPIASQPWNGTSCWDPSSYKTSTFLSYIASTMAANNVSPGHQVLWYGLFSYSHSGLSNTYFNTLRLRQMATILQTIFSSAFLWWKLMNFENCSIYNMAALVQIMASRRTGNKPLSQSIMALFTDTYMHHSASMR